MHAFVDQLVELPVGIWLSEGQELLASGSLAVRHRAWANVDIAIAEQRFHVAAWYVRDAVETAAFLARRQMYRWSREERCLFAAAHGAAEVATVALLAREHVSTESLCALCAPFVRHLDVPLG